MDKPTNWPGDLEAKAREGLVVPARQFPPDGEYRPEEAFLSQVTGGPGDALADFYREAAAIEIEVRRYERRFQETREPIADEDDDADALALAERIVKLRLRQSFDGRGDYIAFLAGQCLKLKLRPSRAVAGKVGEVYAAVARLEAKRPAAWSGRWWQCTLAVPAGIQVRGPDATFGTHTFAWLRYRAERLTRTLARAGLPPASPGYRMFDGGGFALVIDSIRPGEVAEPVVLAPDEDVVAKLVERAAASPDHWDALELAKKVLWGSRQPLGEALGDRAAIARPDGRKAVKWTRKAPRNVAIIEAVRALERGGLPPTRNRDRRWLERAHGWPEEGKIDPDYNPPSGCGIVAKVKVEGFEMSARAVAEAYFQPVPE